MRQGGGLDGLFCQVILSVIIRIRKGLFSKIVDCRQSGPYMMDWKIALSKFDGGGPIVTLFLNKIDMYGMINLHHAKNCNFLFHMINDCCCWEKIMIFINLQKNCRTSAPNYVQCTFLRFSNIWKELLVQTE